MMQKYFTNLFISIVAEDNSYKVFCKAIKNSKQKDKFEKTFPMKPNSEFLNKDLEDYLISLQNKYNFVYIAFLLDSMGQGAVKGVQAEDFEKFNVDYKSIKSVRFNTWSAYASFIDINWMHKLYSKVGLDFIYSPFALLHALLTRYRLKIKSTLYLLNQKDSITLAVFKEDTLSFGVFYKIIIEDRLSSVESVENWEEEEEVQGVENLVALDEESKPDDEMTDLSELDTLDDNFQGEEFLNTDGTQNQSDHEDNEEDMEDIALYGRDLHIFRFLKRALKEYYNNPVYESDFIENMVIFDGYDMSKEIIQSLEEDLYLDLEIHKVDVSEMVCDMSIKEIYG